jgi:hypothetical protein
MVLGRCLREALASPGFINPHRISRRHLDRLPPAPLARFVRSNRDLDDRHRRRAELHKVGVTNGT